MGAENQDDDYLPGSQHAKVSDADIYEQLAASDGNQSKAARELGVSRRYLHGRIEKSATLVALLQDMQEEILDTAENNVFADVRKNDPTANRFVLSTLGKSRGWSQGVAGSGKDGEIVVQINRLSEKPDGA
jgi:hypothetical protein